MSLGTLWIDPNFQESKYRVWLVFLTLLWYLVSLVRSDGGSLCDIIFSKGLQALTLNGSTLYLGVDNQLYSIPMNDSYLDPIKYHIALYDRTPESAPGFQVLGKWTEVPWLKSVVPSGADDSQPLTLVEMFMFQKPIPYLHVVYRVGDAAEPNHKLINSQTGQVENPNKPLKGPYGLWTNGEGEGYLVQKEQGHMMVKKDPIIHPEDKIPVGKATFYLTQTEPGTIEFEDTPGGDHPLPVTLPSFGFIYQESIHFWDLPRKQVLIFKDPVSSWTKSAQKVTTILLNQYLVCSNWNQSPSNDTSTVPGEEENQGLSTLVTVIIWLIVLGALAAGGYFAFQYGKKKSLLKKWTKSESEHLSIMFGSKISTPKLSSKTNSGKSITGDSLGLKNTKGGGSSSSSAAQSKSGLKTPKASKSSASSSISSTSGLDGSAASSKSGPGSNT